MSLQSINLGTPNNNDGDSLFAGGSKINANFVEIYNALAGGSSNTLRIDLSSNTVKGNTLRWSDAKNKFVSVSSTTMRSLGPHASSTLAIMNNSGQAGVDGDVNGDANSLALWLNARQMFKVVANRVTSQSNTRAYIDFGLGNENVTSLSIYTSSVVVRGLNGLSIYTASAEDTSSYVQQMGTTSTGLQFFNTPTLDLATMSSGVRTGTDSSNSLVHSGFVKLNLIPKANSSTTVTAGTGLQGGGDLTGNRAFNVNPYFFPTMCEGLLYNYNAAANQITVTPGVATAFPYSTTGASVAAYTCSNVSIVAVNAPITRTWTTSWAFTAGGSAAAGAVIDTTINYASWYYLYLVANNTTGDADFVVSSNRDIASTQTQINATTSIIQVIRRLGPIRTIPANSAIGVSGALTLYTTPIIQPFSTERVDNATLRFNYGLGPNARFTTSNNTSITLLNADLATSSFITLATISTLVQGSNTAAALTAYTSSLLTSLPPLPGIKAKMDVRYTPNAAFTYAAGTGPTVFWFSEPWLSSNVTTAPPFETQINVAGVNVNQQPAQRLNLNISPENQFISDAVLGSTTVFTSTGVRLRHQVFSSVPATAGAAQAPQQLIINVLGFDVTR